MKFFTFSSSQRLHIGRGDYLGAMSRYAMLHAGRRFKLSPKIIQRLVRIHNSQAQPRAEPFTFKVCQQHRISGTQKIEFSSAAFLKLIFLIRIFYDREEFCYAERTTL